MVIKSSKDVAKLMIERFDELAAMDKTEMGAKQKEWIIELFFDLHKMICAAEKSRNDYRSARTFTEKYAAKSNFKVAMTVADAVAEQIDWELSIYSKVAE
jgi:hypothetical protein